MASLEEQQREFKARAARAAALPVKRNTGQERRASSPLDLPVPVPAHDATHAGLDLRGPVTSSDPLGKIVFRMIEALVHQPPTEFSTLLERAGAAGIGALRRQEVYEALLGNPKAHHVGENVFVYVPRYRVSNEHELLGLLREHDARGLGGVPVPALLESYMDVEDDIRKLEDEGLVLVVERVPTGGKVVYYCDQAASAIDVSEEFKQLWHDTKTPANIFIREYLQSHGIQSAHREDAETMAAPKKDQRKRKRP